MSTFERVEAIFHLISGLPEALRRDAAFAACADDPAIAEEVLQLFLAEEELGRLPSSPGQSPEASWNGVISPCHVDGYQLEHVLGSGGMGTVYLATRHRGESVALKILHAGWMAGGSIPLFLRERDALARLSHPGIARLLDAGVSSQGLPYVAMELVRGQRLDEFADAASNIDPLLLVLIELCEAVSHAHRHLMLHRDIKPSNVLVTGGRHAKLLDFGTAQLQRAEYAGMSEEQVDIQPLTLRYASPEQLEGGRLSTASDVYSLGMTLYRVLAGRLPAALDAGDLATHFHTLQQDCLVPPCDARTRKRLGISKSLAEDLNAIVEKALKYVPSARYPDGGSLADDLRAAMRRGGVQARSKEPLYRLGMVYRRSRIAVSFVLGAVAVVLSGIGVSLYQGVAARHAQHAAARSVTQEQRLAHFLLFDFFDRLQNQAGSIPAQKVAVTEALHSLDDLTATNHDPELLEDSANGFTRLGKLLGSPYEQDLGDIPGARKALLHAVSLSQSLVQAQPQNVQYQHAEAEAQAGMAQTYMGEGNYPQARVWITPAAHTAEAIGSSPGAPVETLLGAASILNTYGDLFGQESVMPLHDGPRSVSLYRETLALYAAGVARDPECYSCRSGMAVENWKLGMLQRDYDSVKALQYYRAALQAIEGLPPAELAKSLARRRHIFIRQRLAEVEDVLGHPREAMLLDEAAHADCAAVVQASATDLRSRRDLADIDSQLIAMYFELHAPEKALTTAKEYRALEENMAKLSPSSQMWVQMRFESEYFESKAEKAIGHTEVSNILLMHALEDAITAAKKPDAASNVLLAAATELTESRRQPALAASFAELEMKDNTDPDADELMELTQAEWNAGNRKAAHLAAKQADAFLNAHPRCPHHDAYAARLRSMQNA